MPHSIHELDVILDGSSPTIHRRLEVPSAMTLVELHEVLQVAMGWENAHLFAFYDEGAHKLPPSSSLAVVAPKRDSKLAYVYDFDDRWSHTISTRSAFEQRNPLSHPQCTAASRACPPEDCGGIVRYQQLVRPPAPKRREKGILPVGFEPSRFDKGAVNQRLADLRPFEVDNDNVQDDAHPTSIRLANAPCAR